MFVAFARLFFFVNTIKKKQIHFLVSCKNNIEISNSQKMASRIRFYVRKLTKKGMPKTTITKSKTGNKQWSHGLRDFWFF